MSRALTALCFLFGPLWAAADPLLSEWQEPKSGIRFIQIEAGCFQMGRGEPLPPKAHFTWALMGYTGQLAADEQPVHEVCLDRFAIGQTEVTANQWQAVMGAAPPVGVGEEPASGISWREAGLFIERINQLAAGQRRFRLPTEAEWEYACRAGREGAMTPSQTATVPGAWYSDWSRRRESKHPTQPMPVAQLQANPWKLHDMLGNVWEWTADAYLEQAYLQHELFNPVIRPTDSGRRVIRGGSHRSTYQEMRCSKRGWLLAADTLPQVGLRLVMESTQE